MAEDGLSHVNTISTKQRNRENLQKRGDLRLMPSNFQPNINNNNIISKTILIQYFGNNGLQFKPKRSLKSKCKNLMCIC